MKINITPQEFADLVMVFLFDKIVRDDEVMPDYEKFNEIMEDMKNKGLKSQLMQYYLGLDANERRNYKRINGAFTSGNNKQYTINIVPDRSKNEEMLIETEEVEKEEGGDNREQQKERVYIKSIVKKVIKKIREIKFRSARRRVLTDEDIEKIIERVLQNE